jgi:hypothetical protein
MDITTAVSVKGLPFFEGCSMFSEERFGYKCVSQRYCQHKKSFYFKMTGFYDNNHFSTPVRATTKCLRSYLGMTRLHLSGQNTIRLTTPGWTL